MISLIWPSENTKSSRTHRLPKDCVSHILSYCDKPTTFSVYLVSRSWYHSVDRCLCMIDTFHYLPEHSTIHASNPYKWFPSGSFEVFEDDERWKHVQAVYVNLGSPYLGHLPPGIKQFSVHMTCDIPPSFFASHFVPCKTLQKLDLSKCETLTDVGIQGLEDIPELSELNLHSTRITDVSNLSKCRALRKLTLSKCETLTDAGLLGLGGIPTLESLDVSRTNISTVCCLSVSQSLRHLNASYCNSLTTLGINGLENISTLETIDLSCCRSITDSLPHLSKCRKLKELNLYGGQVNTVAELSGCPAIHKLNLSYCPYIRPEGFRGLEAIPTLEVLNLMQTYFRDVSQLSVCHSLKELNLSKCREVKCVRGLEAIPTLEILDVSCNGHLSDLSSLSANRTLRKLDASFSCVNDAGIQGLELIPTLQEINFCKTLITTVSCLQRCNVLKILNLSTCNELTNAGIRGLENISTLTVLYLDSTKISDVSCLSSCKMLQVLHVSNCAKMVDAGIRGLEAIPTLEDCNLSSTGISDVTHLSSCRALRKLSISYCHKLTNGGIRGLECIPTLEDLDLQYTKISEVSHLLSCPVLRKLNVADCSKLTHAVIRTLEGIPTLKELIKVSVLYRAQE